MSRTQLTKKIVEEISRIKSPLGKRRARVTLHYFKQYCLGLRGTTPVLLDDKGEEISPVFDFMVGPLERLTGLKFDELPARPPRRLELRVRRGLIGQNRPKAAPKPAPMPVPAEVVEEIEEKLAEEIAEEDAAVGLMTLSKKMDGGRFTVLLLVEGGEKINLAECYWVMPDGTAQKAKNAVKHRSFDSLKKSGWKLKSASEFPAVTELRAASEAQVVVERIERAAETPEEVRQRAHDFWIEETVGKAGDNAA